MLVYGDQECRREPRGLIAELRATLGDVGARPGLARHAGLVGVFVDASELAQGIADARCAGIECRDPAADAAMVVLVALARHIAASWSGVPTRDPGDVIRAVDALAQSPLPQVVRLRRAEGYAFYALYPEAYLVAAASLAPGPRHVIGIRSIGTGLAAMVAVVTHAPLPATVRPHGDPFRRVVTVAPELAAMWTADPATRIAIVDEGPGLSGSSFGAVVDLLEDRGVDAGRIDCLPSHAGELGPLASDRHRARWPRLRRAVVDVDALLVESGRLARWIEDLVGPIVGPLEDLSAGAWRTRRFAGEATWPASVVHQERRKLLARTGTTTWVARFVGLGRHGERALARARTLHTAGFTPEVIGLCHGFLVERWLGDARVLELAAQDRAALIERVGRYLGFRARMFSAAPERGAAPDGLLAMARRNTALALGADAAAEWNRFGPLTFAARARPVEIDGRLHAWEWLVTGSETLIKTDALDHHAAHDLVGCQDIAWDLAGAGVELGLDPEEAGHLETIVVDVAGRGVDPAVRRFLRPCYLAFQLGRHALAIDVCGSAEAARLRAITARYTALLRAELAR